MSSVLYIYIASYQNGILLLKKVHYCVQQVFRPNFNHVNISETLELCSLLKHDTLGFIGSF